MIERIPDAVSKSARIVTLRHPRSMRCEIWRRIVTRPQSGITGVMEAMLDGAPTMGGMGVLAADDEPEITYERKGDARLLFVGGVREPLPVVDRDNSLAQPEAVSAHIEAVADPDTPAHFTPERGDLVVVLPGMGVVIAFTVEGIESPTTISAYVRRFVLQRRDELDHLQPFKGA